MYPVVLGAGSYVGREVFPNLMGVTCGGERLRQNELANKSL